MNEPTIVEIKEAHKRIKPYIHRTPIFTCSTINKMCGAEIFFKCENFQKVGAFKIRGATNAVFSLNDEEASRGVATHSSGNHASALALASSWRGIKCYIVMPEDAPKVKKDAVANYGAEIFFCKPTLEDRELGLSKVVELKGATVIHSYNDYRVIAGQGTAGLELCEDIPNLDVVMTPVGGGGLISGTAIAVSSVSPSTCIIGAEPENANDAYRSLQKGEIVPSINPNTIADGLKTSLGSLTFPIIKKHLKEIITVSEDEIIKAMRLVWERMKIIIEPSSAVPLSAVIKRKSDFYKKRIGIILTGGNVDLDKLRFQ